MVTFHNILLIFILGYTIKRGECIQCYTCDSINNAICNDPFNMSALPVSDCTNENFACLKREMYDKVLNRTNIHRGCIQKHFCEVLAKASDECFTCTYDYCNNALRNNASTTLYLFIFIIYFVCIK